ncbi:SDR family NAD(P)-dependent oxidoreductase [Dactylosporangium sp. NPDC000244]|uniref:type I polyketide synthase n=1 Tax=Dactylosporangium sp. NPDC000244 TaxID=3154365 RepID=UPI0033212CED
MTEHVVTSPADIAVIGIGCRFPGAADPDEYWRNLREGIESIAMHGDEELRARGVPEHLLENPRYVKASAVLEGAEDFDAAFFGYSNREAEVMDPQHRVFLECAHAALEDSGYDPRRYAGLIGVYGGSTMNTYLPMNLMAGGGVVDVVGDLQIMVGNDKEYLTSRVSYKLDLRGPSCVVQTACSSSLVAVHVAVQALLSGECDMALAGGSSIRMPVGGGYLHQPGGTSSPDGHCRAFDADSGGSVVGSGAGVVVLKHLADALRDGDHIYAVVKGSAVNNDGATKASFTAPSVLGQAQAAAGAVRAADVDPADIGFVEAHGTATPLGDPIEVAALTQAFRQWTDRVQYCALGSVKTNIGHLDAAAGIAGFIKAVQTVRHGLIPPTLHFRSPNPQLRLDDSPFYVNNALTEWDSDGPRLAAVNSLGMGGTNAHVIIEEPPRPAPSDPAERGQLLVLSARTSTALHESTARLARWLREHPAANLADVAYTLQMGRRPMPHRRTVLARDVEDAAYALDAPSSKRVLTHRADPPASGVAFLFPGQGTQYPGMARTLHETMPAFRDAVEECLAALEPDFAARLRELLLAKGSTTDLADRLRDTAFAQPALFVVEYALVRLFATAGIRPAAMLGHSIGELVAATVGGTFRLADALRFVVARGAALSALPGGAMLGVPLAPAEAAQYLADGAEISAVNGPAVIVVGGPAEAVDATEQRLNAAGIPAQRLHVSHAFHTAMTEPALGALLAALDGVELRAPAEPWISNVTGTWITPQEATDPGYWARHVRGTVRFADGVATLAERADLVLLEAGPGGVLTGLTRGAGPWAEAIRPVPGAQDRVDARQSVLSAVGALWAAGIEVDWSGLWAGTRRLRLSLPTYPFERRRHWVAPLAEAPAAATAPAAVAGDARIPSPDGWWHMPVWTQSAPVTGAREPGRVLLLDGGTGLAGPLAARLGGTVVASAAALAARLAEPGGNRVDRVVLLPADPGTDLEGLTALAPVVDAARRHAGDGVVELVVVTSGAFDVHGDDPVSPGLAALHTVALLAQQEHAQLRSRGIDLGAADPVAAGVDALAAELATDGAPQLVAYRAGRRWTRTYAPCPDDRAPAAPRPGGTYVILGGLGFFGRTAAAHLLGTAGANVVLADIRSGDAAALRELEGLGGTVEVVTADCADEHAVREVLRRTADRHGRVDAVLFAAGPSATEGVAGLAEMTADSLAPHLRTRVAGLRALAAAADGLPVGACLLVTSLVTALGGMATAPYAATNLWAEAFAAARGAGSEGAARWTTVAWEHWRRPGEQSLGGQRERYAIDADELTVTIDAALHRPAGTFAVSTGPLATRVAAARKPIPAAPAPEPSGGDAPQRHGRPDVDTVYVAPRNEDERLVVEVMGQLLGIERVGVLDNFFDLGGDSLMAMQLISLLRDKLRTSLPMSDMFRDPTAASLAAAIAEHLAGGGAPAADAPAPAGSPASADVVEDGEIEALLAAGSAQEMEDLLNELEQQDLGDREPAGQQDGPAL